MVLRTTHLSTIIVVVCAAITTGCDLGQITQEAVNDIQQTASAIQANKQLLQQAAAEIQTKGLPESPEYRDLRDQYVTARGLSNAYLGHLSLAAQTGDQNSDLAVTAEAAHTAGTKFLQNASRYLDPGSASKGIAFGQVVKVLPATAMSVMKVLAGMPGSQQSSTIKNYYSTFKWKSWDELADASTPAPAGSRALHLKKVSPRTLWNPAGGF